MLYYNFVRNKIKLTIFKKKITIPNCNITRVYNHLNIFLQNDQFVVIFIIINNIYYYYYYYFRYQFCGQDDYVFFIIIILGTSFYVLWLWRCNRRSVHPPCKRTDLAPNMSSLFLLPYHSRQPRLMLH